ASDAGSVAVREVLHPFEGVAEVRLGRLPGVRRILGELLDGFAVDVLPDLLEDEALRPRVRRLADAEAGFLEFLDLRLLGRVASRRADNDRADREARLRGEDPQLPGSRRLVLRQRHGDPLPPGGLLGAAVLR